ncbi:MAG: class I SAM-dependent methyltransferase [Patescibacteria group bacterium]
MFQKITRNRLELFLVKYRSVDKILDVGSGGSSYHRFFPNRITVDIDPGRKPSIVADVHDLPFADNEFSIVLCTEVLEHTKDPRLAVGEMMRVLKKGGILILTTRFVYPLHDTPHDYWRFTKYGLQELFKQWTILEIQSETQSFSALAVLIQRLVFQTNLYFNKIIKGLLLVSAYIINKVNFLIVNEYGSIKKDNLEEDIMSTGYYIVVKK